MGSGSEKRSTVLLKLSTHFVFLREACSVAILAQVYVTMADDNGDVADDNGAVSEWDGSMMSAADFDDERRLNCLSVAGAARLTVNILKKRKQLREIKRQRQLARAERRAKGSPLHEATDP